MKDEAMEAHVKRDGIQIQQVIVIALKCKMVVVVERNYSSFEPVFVEKIMTK